MTQTIEQQNKALVLKAFNTLFNEKDYVAAERFWSPDYMQHSAHIPPGRDGLFSLVKALPDTLRHETELIMAEGESDRPLTAAQETWLARSRAALADRPADVAQDDLIRPLPPSFADVVCGTCTSS